MSSITNREYSPETYTISNPYYGFSPLTHARNTKQFRLHSTLVVSRYFEILIVVINHTEIQPRLICHRIACII